MCALNATINSHFCKTVAVGTSCASQYRSSFQSQKAAKESAVVEHEMRVLVKQPTRLWQQPTGSTAPPFFHFTLHEPPRAYPQLPATAHSTIAETCPGYLNLHKSKLAHPSPNLKPTPSPSSTHCFSNILLSIGGVRATGSIQGVRI